MDVVDGQGVIFLNIGGKHFSHLAVSLLSLRDHWDGPVALLTAGDESREYVEKYLKPETRLGEIQIVEFEYFGSAYLAKTSMGKLSPFSCTVFLDSDTLVVGDFSAVFPDSDRVCITQFSNWSTKDRKIRGRIQSNGWPELLPLQVEQLLKYPVPAINTGILGFSKHSMAFMDRWHDVTHRQFEFASTRKEFNSWICDEISAQLLFPGYPHYVLDDRYNGSPRHAWQRLGPHVPGADPRILHGHGRKFLKATKEVQLAWWAPYLRRALQMNWMQIRSWIDSRKLIPGLIRPKKYLDPEVWDSCWLE